MSSARHDVHATLARALGRQFERHEDPDIRDANRYFVEEALSPDADPEDRILYNDFVNGAWCLLAIVCGAVIIPFVVVRGRLGDVAHVVSMAAVFFCIAGCANALWHKHHAKQARRRARRHGTDDERYARSMRRSLPTNASLVFQALVAVAAAIITAVTIS